MDTTPKIIRLTKANGEFYEGVSLAIHKGFTNSASDRVRLYVTASNIDGLNGATEPGTIVDVSLTGWTVGPQGGGEPKPEHGFLIRDKDGNKRLSLMDQQEYDSWASGNHTTVTSDLKIVAKRDFGSTGYWIPKLRTNIREGWNIIYTKGRYAGAQAMPGAVWAGTRAQALDLIQAYVAAGGKTDTDEINDDGFANRFHALVRLTKKD